MTKIMGTYPKLFSDLNHQNQILKVLSVTLVLAQLLSGAVIFVLVNQGPKVVAIDHRGDSLDLTDNITPKELEGAIRRYLDLRYVWKRDDIPKQARQLESFVVDKSVSAFRKTIDELVKFTKGRNIQSRIYPRSIQIDEKTNTVSIVSDRFTEIEGLKAAVQFRVVLKYQLGDRTNANPWGFYVEKESEATE